MKTRTRLSAKELWPVWAVAMLLVAAFIVFKVLPPRDGAGPTEPAAQQAEAKPKQSPALTDSGSKAADTNAPLDDAYMVLGKSKQMKLRRDLLKLEKVFEDGTTQYDYNHGEMILTIQASGEVLLLPKEI